MKIELLKLLYELYTKHEKNKWKVKRERIVMGHTLTYVFSINNYFFGRYGLELATHEVIIPRASKKFFDQLTNAFSIDMEENDSAYELMYEIEEEIKTELKPFTDMKLPNETREYLANLFYNADNTKLKAWSVIEKNYKPDKTSLTVTINLSRDYNAVIKKDKPVEVGCQRIPIDTIRQIVAAYDNL